jgi:hypothetical protein
MGAWDLYNNVDSIRELMPGQGLLPSDFAVLRVIAKEERAEVLEMIAKGTVREGTPEAELSHTWIAEDYIARHAGVSLRTVTESLGRLKRRGCIDVTSRPRDKYGREQSTYKRINRDWLAAMLTALPEDQAWWKAHRYDDKTKKDVKHAVAAAPQVPAEVEALIAHDSRERKTSRPSAPVAHPRNTPVVMPQFKPAAAATPIRTDEPATVTSNQTVPAVTPPVMVVEPVQAAIPINADALRLATHLGVLLGTPDFNVEKEAARLEWLPKRVSTETAIKILDFTKASPEPERWNLIKMGKAATFLAILPRLEREYEASENEAAA